MIGSGSTLFAPLLPRETYERIYRNGPDVIVAGSTAPLGKAERVPGGWKVSGRWPFASACQHADWLAGFCVMSKRRAHSGRERTTAGARRYVARDRVADRGHLGCRRPQRHRQPRDSAQLQNRRRSKFLFVRVAALPAGSARSHGTARPAAFPRRRCGGHRRRRARQSRRIRRDRPPADASGSVPIRTRAHRCRSQSGAQLPRSSDRQPLAPRTGGDTAGRGAAHRGRPSWYLGGRGATGGLLRLRRLLYARRVRPRSLRALTACNGACAICTPPPSTRGYTSASMSPEARPALSRYGLNVSGIRFLTRVVPPRSQQRRSSSCPSSRRTTRFAPSPPTASASIRTRGVICQDTPHLSLHQPHALSWRPPSASRESLGARWTAPTATLGNVWA